jgi:hypothetical protein
MISRLRRNGSKSTSWKDFIRAHVAVMVGTDFFTAEVLTLKGLKTYCRYLLHDRDSKYCPSFRQLIKAE